MGTLGELLAGLDPDSHKRGREFERICKWYLTNDPVYRHDLQHVWLWDEWPGRWAADAGIDLVAEDRTGGLWAIQAKAYDAAYSVTKADIDSFLSESNRTAFSFRLLIATTDRIGRTARRTMEGQEKQASLLMFGDLEAAQVDWPPGPSDLRPSAAPPKWPRPHQEEAIEAVVKGFDTSDRGQLIMACGTGKTLAALFIAETMQAKRTLVLLPSLSLLAQTVREWTANASDPFDFLPVCSDESVSDRDGAVSTTTDLGFPVTTDSDSIASFLRRRSGTQVVFSTYQSSPRIAEAFRVGRVPRFDLVIADEAHRCAGRVSSDFATVLDAAAIPSARRLFMTATPRYFTGRLVREAREADFEIASMDDNAIFGPVFHRLTFGDAIERDLLSDYQVAVVGVDDARYREWAETGRFVTVDGTKVTDARTLAAQIGVAKAMRRYDLRRTISFHSRVSHARAFARSLPEVIEWLPGDERPRGQVWTDHVSGEMPSGDRDRRIARLRHLEAGGRGLLSNARCLAEGVDVPALDGVAFIDPRRSEVDIIQAVGRAIRKADDKALGTIVLPVFIGPRDDAVEILADSSFKPVWDVLNALRAHDDVLGVELDSLRREIGRCGRRVSLPTKIHLDLPNQIGAEFANAFTTRLVEATTVSWEAWMGLLQSYIDREGHCSVPLNHKEQGRKLGSWVADQKNRYRRNLVDPSRVVQLAALPGWDWNPKLTIWEERFLALQAFTAREGHASVPIGVSEHRLGPWVSDQRKRYRNGSLQPDQIARLESLPGWRWSERINRWEENVRQLEGFAAKHGHLRIPVDVLTSRGSSLKGWLDLQRESLRDGVLSPVQAKRLSQLPGWTPPDPRPAAQEVRMSPYQEARWDTGYESLSRFFEAHGHVDVPQKYMDGEFRLGAWISQQRRQYKRRAIPPDRIARLEAIAGWSWDPTDALWNERFARLLGYVNREGTADIPTAYVDETAFGLGYWVAKQRIVYRRGHLSRDRVARLEELPGWSWGRTRRAGSRRH